MLAILFRIDSMIEKAMIPVATASFVATLAILAWHSLGELPFVLTGGDSPDQLQQTIHDLFITSR